MQRTPRKAPPKVSAAMRRSMLQLEQKALWLRRAGVEQPEPSTEKGRRRAADRLDEIEAELADWLNSASGTRA
ncbi:MAG: hypothetical protein JRN23_03750 [Nitrososphaerota archaeon]|nr:hypothetical protein [Nitrososphaerota archaeon]MDG6967691.1 hypothetical protein [Nitrososphaerota archaeon]MDG6978176.1 hypothetical protein [Nitrososphaerota archaeon]MDG7016666.1 hypothetical protein [Nitrososphaerota archaeon]MDG7021026.1 hypothetical protein [Nitrososphaerota archaeon]